MVPTFCEDGCDSRETTSGWGEGQTTARQAMQRSSGRSSPPPGLDSTLLEFEGLWPAPPIISPSRASPLRRWTAAYTWLIDRGRLEGKDVKRAHAVTCQCLSKGPPEDRRPRTGPENLAAVRFHVQTETTLWEGRTGTFPIKS